MSVPSALQDLPALAPPPGVKSNFDNPETQNAALIKVNTVAIAFMLLLVAIRIYSKAHITHTLWWDDYTCILAATGSILITVIMILNLKLGYGRHLWDIRAITLTSNTIRQLSSISVIYPVVILMVKLSILLLYMRIFEVDRLFRQLIYYGIIFQALFYTAMFGVGIATVASCSSAAAQSNQLCKDSSVLVIVQGAVNVATDFYVLALPIARVVRLQIPLRRKVGLCAIFLTGLAACTVSVARLVVAVIHLHDPDAFWKAALNSEFTVIEMNVGIVAACMTALPAFFNESRIFNRATYKSLCSRLFSSRNRSQASKKTLASDTSKTWQGGFAQANSSHRRLHDNNSFDLMDMATANAVAGGQGFARHPEHAKGSIVQTVGYTVV